MRLILFGATGMVGQGALREALADPDVRDVLAVGRKPAGQQHAKLRELVLPGLLDYSAVEAELTGYDACIFALGVTSSGLTEADHPRLCGGRGDGTGAAQSADDVRLRLGRGH